jgi:hypothetical protein
VEVSAYTERESELAMIHRRDVPLQALEDERVLEVGAGRDDVRVDLLHADFGVPDVVDHPVHGVRAVQGVDVVVAGEPEEPAARVAVLAEAGRGGRRAVGDHVNDR